MNTQRDTDDSDTSGEQTVSWPDNLEVGDTVSLLGEEFEVTGTGPGKATAEHTDDDTIEVELFRWAFTNQVGVEIELGFDQDVFAEKVNKDE